MRVRTYCLWVNIKEALAAISKGQVFMKEITPEMLIAAKKKGYTVYSDCDNLDKNGACKGHTSGKPKKKK